MKVSQSPNRNRMHISLRMLMVYFGVFCYTLSKHISIMDISFQESLGSVPTILGLFGCVILLFSTLLFDKTIKKRTFVVTSTILLIIISNLLPTGYRELLYILIILFSLRNVNLDSVVRFTYCNVAIMTILTLLMVRIGFISDFISIQTNRLRHCYGFSSWTVLPFQYMALLLGYTLFASKPIKIWKLIIAELINYGIYKLSDTATAFELVTAYLILFTLFYNRKTIHRKRKRYYICLFPWIMAAVSFTIDYLYSINVPFTRALNIIFNGRLSLNQMAYVKYGIHLFSTEVKWVGIEDVWNYFVVDNSYVNVLLTYGITGLLLVLFAYTVLLKHCIDKGNHLLVFIICVDLVKNLLFNRLLSYQQTIYFFYIAEILAYRITKDRTVGRKIYESTNS